MRKVYRSIVLSFAAASALLTCAGMGHANIIYDANAAFVANEVGSGVNPFGPFSAGYFDETVLGGFTAFTAADHTDSWAGNPDIQGWSINNPQIVPAVVVNTSASSTNTFFGVTLDPHQILMHEGGIGNNAFNPPINSAILRFTAPTTGNYEIVGSWERLHTGTTEDMILHNGVSIFSSNAANSPFSLMEFITAGDTIDFVVNQYNDGIGGDSTGLYATLTNTVPEPSSFALLGLGGIGLAIGRFRRRQVK